MKNGEILRGPAFDEGRVLALDRAEPADARRDEHADLGRVLRADRPVPRRPSANCDAAMAYWMKGSIFLTSFFSKYCSGSKPLTSAAICAANAVASNFVMRPTPLRPAQSPSHVGLGPDAERRHQPDARHDNAPVHAASVRCEAQCAGATSSWSGPRCNRRLP